MKLVIVRHCDAADVDGRRIRSDEERPLTPRGRKEAAIVGGALRGYVVSVDAVYSSPLVRARETAEIIAGLLGFRGRIEHPDLLAPGNWKTGFEHFLAGVGRESVLIVGHAPDVGEMTGGLVTGLAGFAFPFRKGGTAVLHIDDPLERPAVRLLLFADPSALSKVQA